MSTLRKDPITGGWVIIAEERALRPDDFVPPERSPLGRDDCPFCHGAESKTPPEIRADRPGGGPPNSPGWTTRVVPNKYAAMRIEGNLNRIATGFWETMHGIGAHEVIIETATHLGRLAEFSQPKLESVLRIYRERMIDLHRDVRFRYVQVFRNYGSAAGASLEHPHSQLIALPIPPRSIVEELACAREHWFRASNCIFCEMLREEARERSRVVAETAEFFAVAPYAPRFPYETWIYPKRHGHDFQHADDAQLADLARILRLTLWALQKGLNDPPFNFMIHGAPEAMTPPSEAGSVRVAYHWHIEIIPRLTKQAGFEWGTGFYINPVAPETAAARMRDVLRDHPEPPTKVTE